ncbi:MAG TPA: hypothetical protein RMG48_06715 [Myxococcales bacterium LLY-WYZ-16_1]|nr:hypothetical protein [Myxococcales bacterium LLY-WYZ-16_1]
MIDVATIDARDAKRDDPLRSTPEGNEILSPEATGRGPGVGFVEVVWVVENCGSSGRTDPWDGVGSPFFMWGFG